MKGSNIVAVIVSLSMGLGATAIAQELQFEGRSTQRHLQRQAPVLQQFDDTIPSTISQPNSTHVSPAIPTPILEIRTDFQQLLNRYERALQATQIVNQNHNRSLVEVVTHQQDKHLSTSASPVSQPLLVTAKHRFREFESLIATQNYQQAQQVWESTRQLLHNNIPRRPTLTPPEVRAIWLDRNTIVQAQSKENLARLFDYLAAAGINTVLLETVNASYPIYPSQVAPEQNPLTKGWDPLEAAVTLAHEQGMELHAWVWVFAAANANHNPLLNQSPDYLGPVLSVHPDWAIVTQAPAAVNRSPKTFFDPAHPAVRHYLLSLLEEITTQYDVDGIHLDYIRYPFQHPHATDYDGASRQQFLRETGIDPQEITRDNHTAWLRWQDFRTQQIDTFVRQVSQRLRMQRPDLILSAAVFPYVRGERLAKIQQNWEAWAQQGDLDVIFLMSYVEETPTLEKLTQPWLELSFNHTSFVIPGLRLLEVPEAVTLDQIQLVRDFSSGGYGLFATQHLSPQLLETLAVTQGKALSTQPPIPYRQPLQSAALSYQTLLQEWHHLIQQEQLVMDATQMQTWAMQADTLNTVLQQLVQQPTPSNFMTAKVALSGARSRLRPLFQNHVQKSPYQVEVWENQLASIDQLLRYGEKKIASPNHF